MSKLIWDDTCEPVVVEFSKPEILQLAELRRDGATELVVVEKEKAEEIYNNILPLINFENRQCGTSRAGIQ